MPRKIDSWAKRRVRADRRARQGAGERREVVEEIRREAKKNGATLKNNGEGGVDPRLALKLFRRAEWRCEVDGCETPSEDLDLDHIGGHPKEIQEDPEARKNPRLVEGAKTGHVDKMEALHVVCARHHDEVHDRERAIEEGKKPAPMSE